jgi:hypothetical protein
VRVRPAPHGAGDVRGIVLGGQVENSRLCAARQRAELGQELHGVAVRHLPVDDHAVGHLAAAHFDGIGAIVHFCGTDARIFQNLDRDFSNRARIVDDETVFHGSCPACRLLPVFGNLERKS